MRNILTEDGWNQNELGEILGCITTLEQIKYEVNSCVRGVYIDGNRPQDLVNSLRVAINSLIERIDDLESDITQPSRKQPSRKLGRSTPTW